jgi:glutathione synthase
LEEILTPIASKDNFVQKLLEISKKSHNFEKKQKIRLGIFRNDYLIDKSQDFIFLQDCKTSCVGFNSYTNNLLCFYNYFDQKYPEIFAKYKNKEKENTKEIPQDKGDTIEKFSQSIVEALKLAFPETKEYLVVFVTNKDEQAKYDFELENLINGLKDEKDEKIKIKSVKLSLSEINKKITKDGEGNLLLDGNKVSMVYFNTGDKEEDYLDEDSWNGRELVELSTAIKVPDVNILLTSLRIFQYYLTKPGIIMHYYDNALIINDILRFFGGIYYAPDLEKEKQTELFNKIQAEPNKYILKPFHGNKNILTGEKLKGVVPAGEGEPSEELKNGIILEVSTPPEHEALIIRDEKTSIENVISEYSIYGIILSNDNNLTTNKSVGYLVRTRNKDNLNDYESSLGDEKGNVVLDLPCLVEKVLKTNLTHKIEVKQEEIQKYLDDKKAAEEEAKKKAEEEAKKKAEEEEAKKKAE